MSLGGTRRRRCRTCRLFFPWARAGVGWSSGEVEPRWREGVWRWVRHKADRILLDRMSFSLEFIRLGETAARILAGRGFLYAVGKVS